MKIIANLLVVLLPFLSAAQIKRVSVPVGNRPVSGQVKTDSVPVRTNTKPPVDGTDKSPLDNKPLKPVNTPKLVAELLPPANLHWSAHYVASDPDVKPAVWVYEYHTGELKYITNKKEIPQWEADFIWTHIPPGAAAARIISTQLLPLLQFYHRPSQHRVLVCRQARIQPCITSIRQEPTCALEVF